MIGSALTALDGALAVVLPGWMSLALYGTVLGAGAMMSYAALSPQARLARLQEELRDARARMHAYDGEDAAEIGRLVRESVGLSLRQLRLVFLPTLAAAVPVLLMVAWLEAAYAHELPAAGTPVEVEYHDDRGSHPAPGSPVPWPPPGDRVALSGPGGAELLTLPLDHPRTVVAGRGWWNRLFASPVGYLPAEAEVDAVSLGLPERRFLPFGPDWLRGWHTVFLGFLSLGAVGVKYAGDIR